MSKYEQLYSTIYRTQSKSKLNFLVVVCLDQQSSARVILFYLSPLIGAYQQCDKTNICDLIHAYNSFQNNFRLLATLCTTIVHSACVS